MPAPALTTAISLIPHGRTANGHHITEPLALLITTPTDNLLIQGDLSALIDVRDAITAALERA